MSRYYLDWCLLKHTVQSHLIMQQYFKPPKLDSIEIGDYIEVMEGEHMGRHGVVDWFLKKDTKLWFQDIFTVDNTECSGRLSSISVPTAIVQRMSIMQTVQFTKERGYDIRPGDVVTVACGPEYEAKGVVQSVDFPNACLTLLCNSDHALVSTINLNSGISNL